MVNLFVRKKQLPNIPYVEFGNMRKISKKRHKPKKLVVVSAHTASDSGAALAVATHLHNSSSWIDNAEHALCGHYVIDENSKYCSIPDYVVAPGRKKSELHIIVCCKLTMSELDRDEKFDKTCENLSNLLAKLCDYHKLNPRKHINFRIQGSWPSSRILEKTESFRRK